MSKLTRDGTAEPVSRDQILRRERGQRTIHFPCSAPDHEQDWQPCPVVRAIHTNIVLHTHTAVVTHIHIYMHIIQQLSFIPSFPCILCFFGGVFPTTGGRSSLGAFCVFFLKYSCMAINDIIQYTNVHFTIYPSPYSCMLRWYYYRQ